MSPTRRLHHSWPPPISILLPIPEATAAKTHPQHLPSCWLCARRAASFFHRDWQDNGTQCGVAYARFEITTAAASHEIKDDASNDGIKTQTALETFCRTTPIVHASSRLICCDIRKLFEPAMVEHCPHLVQTLPYRCSANLLALVR